MTLAERVGLDWQPIAGVFGESLSARARPARRDPDSVKRNLILAYTPGWQSVEDLRSIGIHIRRMDPSIAVFIVPQIARNRLARFSAAGKPTLVVSPGPIAKFQPARGKVYQGAILPKFEELQRLRRAGLPVPQTVILTPGLMLDPAEWGEFVVVKPTDIGTSSRGAGVHLMRSHRVRYMAPEEYPSGHPGRLGPMLVQQFIDTGEHITAYRVLTFFGEPLYALVEDSTDLRVALDAPDDDIERAVVASQATHHHVSRFIDEPDVIALARAAHAAIPEVPLKGCDILREKGSGKLYVLELNCGGNTWHFSSRHHENERAGNGSEFEKMRYGQYDAMQTAARVLVARTNAEAA